MPQAEIFIEDLVNIDDKIDDNDEGDEDDNEEDDIDDGDDNAFFEQDDFLEDISDKDERIIRRSQSKD